MFPKNRCLQGLQDIAEKIPVQHLGAGIEVPAQFRSIKQGVRGLVTVARVRTQTVLTAQRMGCSVAVGVDGVLGFVDVRDTCLRSWSK